MNPLEYVETPIPEDGKFRISPSQFSNFVSAPHNWYRSEVAGEEGFTHSTSTVIGTIVHYCCEMVAKGEMVDKKAIEEYIDMLEVHDDYDPAEVRKHYQAMAECVVNNYVLDNEFLEIEQQHVAEVKDGFYAAGTLDALQGTKDDCMITDYKTYNSKTKPREFHSYYKYQLLVYAYILRKKGYNVTRIRLVYVNRHIDGGISEKTQKPLKSYPPEVTPLTENVLEEDFDFIEGLLELAVDTVKFHNDHPELAHIVWHDPRLRPE